MRIATSQMFDAPSSRMSALNIQADKLQTQIATGKRVTAASDDAGAWTQLQRLGRAEADDGAYSANVKLAQGLMSQADAALESVGTQIQRAQEIATAAANGTLTAQNRQAYATELGAIIDELLSIANTSDVRGEPVFGGSNGQAYVKGSDGTIAYAGTGEPSAIPVGQNDSIKPGVTGDRAFGDMFARLATLRDALAAGNAPPQGAAEGLQAVSDQVDTARASVGARAIRLDLVADRLTDAGLDRADTRTDLESVDMSAAITELQKTLTILQATQASFTKLSSLSLFDYLR